MENGMYCICKQLCGCIVCAVFLNPYAHMFMWAGMYAFFYFLALVFIVVL